MLLLFFHLLLRLIVLFFIIIILFFCLAFDNNSMRIFLSLLSILLNFIIILYPLSSLLFNFSSSLFSVPFLSLLRQIVSSALALFHHSLPSLFLFFLSVLLLLLEHNKEVPFLLPSLLTNLSLLFHLFSQFVVIFNVKVVRPKANREQERKLLKCKVPQHTQLNNRYCVLFFSPQKRELNSFLIVHK